MFTIHNATSSKRAVREAACRPRWVEPLMECILALCAGKSFGTQVWPGVKRVAQSHSVHVGCVFGSTAGGAEGAGSKRDISVELAFEYNHRQQQVSANEARRRGLDPARNLQTPAEFHGQQQRRPSLAPRTNSVTVAIDLKQLEVRLCKRTLGRLRRDSVTGWIDGTIGKEGQHGACVGSSLQFGRAILSKIDVI